MLRIVSGSFGGRRVATPSGGATRPTSERVREALFSMLGDISGTQVLDLFAGSGALGLEALSRGAVGAVFVDRDRRAVECTRNNLDALGIEAEVIRADWRQAIDRLHREGRRFDVVFVDPPYADGPKVFGALAERLGGLLATEATVVCESPPESGPVPGMLLRRDRRHGDTLLRLYGCD